MDGDVRVLGRFVPPELTEQAIMVGIRPLLPPCCQRERISVRVPDARTIVHPDNLQWHQDGGGQLGTVRHMVVWASEDTHRVSAARTARFDRRRPTTSSGSITTRCTTASLGTRAKGLAGSSASGAAANPHGYHHSRRHRPVPFRPGLRRCPVGPQAPRHRHDEWAGGGDHALLPPLRWPLHQSEGEWPPPHLLHGVYGGHVRESRLRPLHPVAGANSTLSI